MRIPRDTRAWALVAVIALTVAAVSALASDWLAGDSAAGPAPGHVHALGVDPADGSVFVATHTGLFRLPSGVERARRVSHSRQDTMGFTVAGPRRFLGSGHPDLRDDLPPLLGLIESRDAGKTWSSISLLGEVDFHALRSAEARIVGNDLKSGRLLLSEDAGRSWRSFQPPEPLGNIVLDPADSDLLVAAGDGHVLVSADAGRTWEARGELTGLLAWARTDLLYLADATGRMWMSGDRGLQWQERGRLPSLPAALVAAGPRLLYAATHEGDILRSDDGGATWATRGRL